MQLSDTIPRMPCTWMSYNRDAYCVSDTSSPTNSPTGVKFSRNMVTACLSDNFLLSRLLHLALSWCYLYLRIQRKFREFGDDLLVDRSNIFRLNGRPDTIHGAAQHAGQIASVGSPTSPADSWLAPAWWCHAVVPLGATRGWILAETRSLALSIAQTNFLHCRNVVWEIRRGLFIVVMS